VTAFVGQSRFYIGYRFSHSSAKELAMPVPPASLPLIVSTEGKRTLVRFTPGVTLSETNMEEVGQHLIGLIDGSSGQHLVLDFKGVAMLTSIALGKLINLNARVSMSNGRLTLANLSPSLREIFKITRLDTILEISKEAI
jgi:anti-anti-sigma factor